MRRREVTAQTRAIAALLMVLLPGCTLLFDSSLGPIPGETVDDTGVSTDVASLDGATDAEDTDASLQDAAGREDTGPADSGTDVDDVTDSDGIDVTGNDVGDVMDVTDVTDAGGPDGSVDAGPGPSVSVTAPEAGDYTLGDALEISWLATGARDVLLSLVEPTVCDTTASGVVVPTIVSTDATDSPYVWPMPTTLSEGEFRIRAIVTSGETEAVGCSPVFRLVQPAGCETLTCAEQNRSCSTASGTPVCGSCTEGYLESDGVCAQVDCGTAPAPPVNAILGSVSSTRFGGVASYTCVVGHTTSGAVGGTTSVTRRCGAAGTWEAAIGVCQPVECGANPAPAANARLTALDRTTFGGTASYVCDSGYQVAGGTGSTYIRSCTADGTWTEGAFCELVDCGAPPLIANGSRTFTSTTYASSASYTCSPGYTRSGSASLSCDSNGSWGTAPTCTPVDCGNLPAPANGSVDTPEGTTPGATATYRCGPGYTLTGTATRTCEAAGTWSGSAAVCNAIDCGPPPSVTNGSRTFTSTTFSSTAEYTCSSGYTRSGSATLTCRSSGTWDTPPTCVDTDECVTGIACTAVGNICTNTAGSWQCSCAAGYTGSSVTGGDAACVGPPPGAFGAACTADSECPNDGWCSTVSGFRRCSPRLFDGTAHPLDFVFIPSGTFQQGTPGETDQERPYTATISRPYFVSRTEVTQGQWKAATGGTNPSCFQSIIGSSCTTDNANDNAPVEQVDWYSAVAYANWLSSSEGLSPCYALTPSTCADSVSDWAGGDSVCTGATFVGLTCTGYRLLTESEWERAARGGTTSTYFWGEATDTATVRLNAWFNDNTESRTQSVGTRQANGYGLYDVSGNVWEWVWDWVYGTSEWSSYPSGSATDDLGPSSGSFRGVRGGSYYSVALELRSAFRSSNAPDYRELGVGFRLARTLTPDADCGAPPIVTNGTRTFGSTRTGSIASYSCDRGYTLSGSATLSCAANGSWGTPPSCGDTNECAGGSVCTALGNACINTAGSWQCSCAAGYTGATVEGGNASCVDGIEAGTLGAACSVDAECPTSSWCSTVPGFRRCAPRVFSATAHQQDFVFIPAGTFLQGTPGATNQERPYTATISRNYFVSRTEVTQGQWKAVTGGTNPSCFQSTTESSCTTDNANDNGPVEQLDWYSAVAYANWLSSNEGLSPCYTLTPSTCADSVSDWAGGDTICTGATFVGLTCTGYRLLTESEWERAARAGTTSTYYWGEAADTATVGLNAWFSENAGSRTQSVGGRQANGYGLFDMSGNVWEWVGDWGSPAYPTGSATDYTGPASGSGRRQRGGSWGDDASFQRSAVRSGEGPSGRSSLQGFRLARTL